MTRPSTEKRTTQELMSDMWTAALTPELHAKFHSAWVQTGKEWEAKFREDLAWVKKFKPEWLQDE